MAQKNNKFNVTKYFHFTWYVEVITIYKLYVMHMLPTILRSHKQPATLQLASAGNF